MRKRMDWRSVKFDWNRARAFLVTAEEGSLSAAARALGMAQPTLGRQVTALEEELGVALFERTGRGLRLTPPGVELVDHVRAMGEAATRVSLAARGQSQDIAGQIRITASEVYSAFLLPPVIARLRREQPALEIEIVASNEVRDLRRREADIAVRSTRPTDPALIGKLIGTDHGYLYASPAYLARIGPIRTPADLAGAEFFGFDRNELLIEALKGLGAPLSFANFPVVSTNHIVHFELAKAGVGIGVFPAHIGDAEPGLVRALPALPSFQIPVWLVAHRDLVTSRRVRLVFDMLSEMLPAAIGRPD